MYEKLCKPKHYRNNIGKNRVLYAPMYKSNTNVPIIKKHYYVST